MSTYTVAHSGTRAKTITNPVTFTQNAVKFVTDDIIVTLDELTYTITQDLTVSQIETSTNTRSTFVQPPASDNIHCDGASHYDRGFHSHISSIRNSVPAFCNHYAGYYQDGLTNHGFDRRYNNHWEPNNLHLYFWTYVSFSVNLY
ncbi:hypothetical protein TWF192_003740 [Orbilia oligospora]|nr:hypothetical protein TWF192_003740 [Orbilia oligospora]